MRVIHHRTSRKMVNDLCESFGFRLVIHENLGNRRDYWYSYSVVDKESNECLIQNASLRECRQVLLPVCEKRMEVMLAEAYRVCEESNL